MFPEDYSIKKVEESILLKEENLIANVTTDLFLTDTYLDYAYHLANGKLNPNELYDDWIVDKNLFNINKDLNTALSKNEISKSLNNLKPKTKLYSQLKSLLSTCKDKLDSDSSRTILEKGDKIRPFQSNSRIINIRKRLNEIGFLNDSLVNNSKELDSLLIDGLKTFQASKKLRTDAIIGNGTIDALNTSNKDNYNSIIANLERLRWYPRNKGEEHILVNIADYNLDYITKNDTTHHVVMVGRTDRKTPVFSSKLRFLEFNPKWYIPPTIKNNDIIPSIRKSKEYISKKGLSIYDNGIKVNPDSVDWSSSAVSKFKYVQRAGGSNALGRVKIIFPNKFSVYLHDTPSKSLFKRNFRARSSGCIRVQNPLELSAKILREKDNWSKSEIDTIINKRITKRAYVENEVQVHLLYWTITFDNKKEQFINDVYKLDNDLAKNLKTKLLK